MNLPHDVLRSETPPVIVGSGLAGLTAALAMAPRECLLVTAGELTDGAASMWAQGGIAAALGADDSPALHAQDTLRAGAYSGDPQAISAITGAAPAVVEELLRLGVRFDRNPSGVLDLHLEGGHSRHRIVHAGDRSGAAITSVVAGAVARAEHVQVLTGHRAVRLLTDADGRIRGLTVTDRLGAEREIPTDAVILATGGLGGLFAHTTNPSAALGQGVALAARAGARTDDLHLVQFHPTALDVGRDPMPLLTEALRGAGATLLADGNRFVDELQARDVVAAAVWHQLAAGRQVHLDARAVPRVQRRFPAVAALAADAGLGIADDLLPVRPAVHYSMGGVTVDAQARTSVPGLWAIGEVSRTGLHGANRLASNSLLEAVVTGHAAARSVTGGGRWDTATPTADRRTIRPRDTDGMPLAQVRALLDTACGVLRDGPTLQQATARLETATGDDEAYVAWLVARSALAHPSSIGGHRRTDDPDNAIQEAS